MNESLWSPRHFEKGDFSSESTETAGFCLSPYQQRHDQTWLDWTSFTDPAVMCWSQYQGQLQSLKATFGQRDVQPSAELRSHFWPICVARMAKPIQPCSLVPMIWRSTSEPMWAAEAEDLCQPCHGGMKYNGKKDSKKPRNHGSYGHFQHIIIIGEGTKPPNSFDRFDLYICVKL